MARRTGINISGHYYVVSINVMPFPIYTLNSKKLKGRKELYFLFFNSPAIRQGVLTSGYVDFIPTAVSSN